VQGKPLLIEEREEFVQSPVSYRSAE